jgi:hypothetical protein
MKCEECVGVEMSFRLLRIGLRLKWIVEIVKLGIELSRKIGTCFL